MSATLALQITYAVVLMGSMLVAVVFINRSGAKKIEKMYDDFWEEQDNRCPSRLLVEGTTGLRRICTKPKGHAGEHLQDSSGVRWSA